MTGETKEQATKRSSVWSRLFRRYDIDSLHNRDEALMRSGMKRFFPLLETLFRSEVRGLERIPSGPALYVGNHNAVMMSPDSFLFGAAAYRALGMEAVPFGLGHEVAISMPLVHQIVMPIGAIRASHHNAARLFEAGKKVLVYPGGDLDAMRPFSQRDRVVFGPRRGYIRLAVRENVPIIPVVAAGAHSVMLVLTEGRWLARTLRLDKLRIKVWPICFSIPWGITLGPPPPYLPIPTRIVIEVLPPVTWERWGEKAAADTGYVEQCHKRVHTAMESTLKRLVAEGGSGIRARFRAVRGTQNRWEPSQY